MHSPPSAAPFRAFLLTIACALAMMTNANAGIKQTITKSHEPGRTVTCVDDVSNKAVECPDTMQFYETAGFYVDHLQSLRRFNQLDELFNTWCTGKDRFPEGTWKLAQYQSQFARLFTTWNTWDRYSDFLRDWKSERPGSEAARFTEALYWSRYAWHARGTNYAHTVSGEAWELFKERLQKADAILSAPRPLEKDCAAWYPLQIEVARLLGKSAQARAAFDAGVKRYPQYHSIYFAMAATHEPKWGGSAAAYDKFAEEATRLTRGFEGRGMYARLYWIQDATHGMPFDPDNPTSPTWKKLRAGYDDLLKKYPANYHITNQYASVACRSDDSVMYRKLRSRSKGFLIEKNFRIVPVRACDRRHSWNDGDAE